MPFQIEQHPDSKANALPQTAVECSRNPDDLLSILANQDQLVEHIRPPKEGQQTFEVNGVPFNAKHMVMNDSECRLAIWGTLGYLPYSLNDHEQRNDIIKIMNESARLSVAKFGIDHEMKIITMGRFTIPHPLTPDYLFVPLVSLLQEARPYIKLIGERL